MANNILKFIRKSHINKFLIGFSSLFIFGTLLALFVIYPVRIAYLGIASGEQLLNVQSVVATQTVEQDEALLVQFCRSPLVRITASDNIRTFYLTQDNTAVFERRLPENIRYERTDTPCQPLRIKVNQRPNELGKYRFCQEFDFYTEYQQKKTARFCSTEYEVIATPVANL